MPISLARHTLRLDTSRQNKDNVSLVLFGCKGFLDLENLLKKGEHALFRFWGAGRVSPHLSGFIDLMDVFHGGTIEYLWDIGYAKNAYLLCRKIYPPGVFEIKGEFEIRGWG